MNFDYERDTKDHYKRAEVATEYHAAFTSDRGWKAWRHRVVADGERDAVRRMLARVPHARVLDLPCGTGKLAPVFAGLGSSVTAWGTSVTTCGLCASACGMRGRARGTNVAVCGTRVTACGARVTGRGSRGPDRGSRAARRA